VFIWIYLAIYFALIAGALIALSVGGVLAHFSLLPILLALFVAIGLGVLLAVVWRWHPSRRGV
jgi:hypothetical protein